MDAAASGSQEGLQMDSKTEAEFHVCRALAEKLERKPVWEMGHPVEWDYSGKWHISMGGLYRCRTFSFENISDTTIVHPIGGKRRDFFHDPAAATALMQAVTRRPEVWSITLDIGEYGAEAGVQVEADGMPDTCEGIGEGSEWMVAVTLAIAKFLEIDTSGCEEAS